MEDLELNLRVSMNGGSDFDSRVASFGAPRNLTESRIWSDDESHTRRIDHIEFSKPVWSDNGATDGKGAQDGVRDETERNDRVTSIRKTVTLEFAENKKRLLSVGDAKSPV